MKEMKLKEEYITWKITKGYKYLFLLEQIGILNAFFFFDSCFTIILIYLTLL